MRNLILLIAVFSMSLYGCDFNESIGLKKVNFLGTTWAMQLKGDSYNFIWLSCDSTYIDYNDEIENYYYGRFEINNDTLMLIQEFEDDYHKFGSYPVKRKSFSKSKYLILNDSLIEFIYRNGNKVDNNSYLLKQHFDCNSLYEY